MGSGSAHSSAKAGRRPAKAVNKRLLRKLALAIGMIAVVAAISARMVRGPANPLAELAAAVGDHRPVEPRLSGGFRYAPAARVRAVGLLTSPMSAEVRIAVGHLEKRA